MTEWRKRAREHRNTRCTHTANIHSRAQHNATHAHERREGVEGSEKERGREGSEGGSKGARKVVSRRTYPAQITQTRGNTRAHTTH